MEVKLQKQYPLQVSAEQAWAVLSDVHATAGCMPGAAITEQIDDTHFKGSVRAKVGPAVMSFAGDIELLASDAATRSVQMLGKGADKAGSSASMNLTARIEPGAEPGTSTLIGDATVLVSGKLAQFGSRLLVPVSDMMLGQFADNFRAVAAALAAADAEAAAAPATAVATATADGPATAAAAATPGSEGPPASGAPPAPPAAAAARGAPAAPVMPRPVKEINALALMWGLIKHWFAGLFGKKS